MDSTERQNICIAHRVAVIGAGMSGVLCAARLIQQGRDVTVFERGSGPGGVWRYEDAVALEDPAVQYPTEAPEDPNDAAAAAAAEISDPNASSCLFDADGDESLTFAPPGPCYAGLTCLVPTSVDKTPLLDWPEDNADIVGHAEVERYIREIAERYGVDQRTRYGTRVDAVRKTKSDDDGSGQRWTLHVSTRHHNDKTSDVPSLHTQQRHWQHGSDAVVVAAGHYHRPRIPAIPGLAACKRRFPSRVTHAKSYRTPDRYRGQTVLVIGGGISALDIARELGPYARKVYQSCRGSKFDLRSDLLPGNAERIGAVARFPEEEDARFASHADEQTETCMSVALVDSGRIVSGIDAVVLATGYITSYPFLESPIQAPAATPLTWTCGMDRTRSNGTDPDADPLATIVTQDGFLAQHLYADLFYIPDPSLVFAGTPYRVPSFVLFDVQAELVARVLAGKARLPAGKEMREQTERDANGVQVLPVERFHRLAPADRLLAYMERLGRWMNEDADGSQGLDRVEERVDEAWVGRYKQFLEDPLVSLRQAGRANRRTR